MVTTATLLSTGEVARRLKISRQAVHKAILEGRLRSAAQIGRRWLVDPQDAARWGKARKKTT